MQPLGFLAGTVLIVATLTPPGALGQTVPEASPSPESAQADRAATAEQLAFFERRVRPLLLKRCAECHSAKAGEVSGDLDLATPRGIRAGGSRGTLAEGNDPNTSLLLRAVRYRDPQLEMPPAGKLPAAELAILERWVQLGVPVPASSDDHGPVAKQRDLTRAGRDFWAFQPLRSVPLPAVANPAWSKQPLDHFVLQRLERAGLTPSPPADRRDLIRRLSYGLTGLPPTFEEVEAFLADKRPDAYQRLVARLLSSPRYGERWARFWLDLARYTDTTASWLKSTGDAWRYRDWVIRAWNTNLPYDRFVALQLAADWQPDALPEEHVALGFLGLSPTYWKELRLEPTVIEQVVAEEWDERIDAVTRTFLGLTVACARCHDHKFDPVTMRDYYALAGVFANTQLDDQPLVPRPQLQAARELRTRREALEGKLAKLQDKASPEAVAARRALADLRRDPLAEVAWANVVKEASIHVLPDGDERTRLEYREVPRDVPIYRRGNPGNPGDVVPRGFLSVFGDAPAFREGSGRGELVQALFDQGQGLVARVIVNRIWAEHFGQGIVRTTSNLGQQGERPTHPELLEYLASEFVARGWDLKWLQRTLVMSATYRQSSQHRRVPQEQDPENRLLWRMPRRRLHVEMWRDSLLAAAGNLDGQLGGAPQPIDNLANRRRTLYGTIARRELDQMLRLYDFPEPTAHSPGRVLTTTPLQQLFVFNAPLMLHQAGVLTDRVLQDAAGAASEAAEPRASFPYWGTETAAASFWKSVVASSYRRVLARLPSAREQQLGRQFLAAAAPYADEGAVKRRVQAYVHALLGLNEVMYLD